MSERKIYRLYYDQYDIVSRDFLQYVEIVYCEDIYHEVGKKICSSIKAIRSVRYVEAESIVKFDPTSIQAVSIDEEWERSLILSGYTRLRWGLWVRYKERE